MTFVPYRPRGAIAPDLTGQRLGLCVVDSKAPSVNNSARWRIRCQAITPERDQCGEIFYLSTSHVRGYQRPGNELFACKACRLRRRQARQLVRFTCEGCSSPVEMPRSKLKQRSAFTQGFCKDCAIRAGRTLAQGARITRRAQHRGSSDER